MDTRTDWIVRVYNEDEEIASWEITDRTEREAFNEASPEVDQYSTESTDWTLTRKGN